MPKERNYLCPGAKVIAFWSPENCGVAVKRYSGSQYLERISERRFQQIDIIIEHCSKWNHLEYFSDNILAGSIPFLVLACKYRQSLLSNSSLHAVCIHALYLPVLIEAVYYPRNAGRHSGNYNAISGVQISAGFRYFTSFADIFAHKISHIQLPYNFRACFLPAYHDFTNSSKYSFGIPLFECMFAVYNTAKLVEPGEILLRYQLP